jgi:hypothetical protein
MTALSQTLARLTEWYLAQCNGEWEHRYGITIESLDNPGWRLRIDLAGTRLADRDDFELSSRFDHPGKWMVVKKHSDIFEGADAPDRLEAIITAFLEWKDGSNG